MNKVAVLTSKKSWFVPYAKKLVSILNQKGYGAYFFFRHEDIGRDFKFVFILSYFRIVPQKFLRHRHNLVVHESDLPRGRGWAPLFWQILEGKDKIPIVLFEADEKCDAGNIYLRDSIVFEGHELYDEIRKKQAQKTIDLCLKFLDNHNSLKPVKQTGKPNYYCKRTPKDSELDVNQTIAEQFNLLRIVDNEEFPAFFFYKGCKYIVKLSKEVRKK